MYHLYLQTEAFRGWMFKILSAKCKRKMKSYVDIRETEQVLIENSAGAEDDPIQSTELKHAFAALSDEERMILSLNVFGGYDSGEIADIMGLNRNTVRSKQSRALQKMKAILGENSDHKNGGECASGKSEGKSLDIQHGISFLTEVCPSAN